MSDYDDIDLSKVTLATPANMRRFKEANPDRKITQPDGSTVTLLGRTCLVLSLTNPHEEQFSADAGDYWRQADDEPLKDGQGCPMVLAIRVCRYEDALTGEVL